jgi:hypothetical protein
MNTTTNLVPGTQVFFGRTAGEKTLGEVVKVNGKSVKVKQLEARGTLKDHKVGTVWRVALSMVTPATGNVAPAAPNAPAARRPEAEIKRDIAGCYSRLSPENISCDGMLSRAEVARRAAAVRARLRVLFSELGRTITEEEARA